MSKSEVSSHLFYNYLVRLHNSSFQCVQLATGLLWRGTVLCTPQVIPKSNASQKMAK